MTTQHILHISNDYTGSKVYKNLFSELDRQDLIQTIYTPIRSKSQVGLNAIEFQNINSKIIYSPILNKHIDRLVYPYKIYKIYKNLEKKINLNDINYIHAHTWYSDGGVAFFLSKKYDIPYTVTVRNTDINFFYKKLRYLASFGRKILAKSDNVIFICAPYKYRLMRDSKIKELIQFKSKIIPNGVDKFWLDNSNHKRKPSVKKKINVLFVGKLDDNKQIINLIKSIIKINKSSYYKVKLHIVGSGGNEERNVIKLAHSHPNYVDLHGAIYDKNKLLSLYQMCDVFAMPSRHETFGLVYIEALLQGLPILYTNNEGVDALYGQEIGEKVMAHTKSEISEKLLKIISNLDKYYIPNTELKKNHDWQKIALKLINIYKLHTNK